MRLRIQHKEPIARPRYGEIYAVFETETDYFAIVMNGDGRYDHTLKVFSKEFHEPWVKSTAEGP